MKRPVLLPIVFLALSSAPVMAYESNSKSENSNRLQTMESRDEKNQKDAIEVILKDHAHIQELLAKLDKSLGGKNGDSRTQFMELKEFLSKHEEMEQTVWYPELEKQHADLKKIIVSLKEEEKKAGDMLKKLEGMKEDKEWDSKVRKFMEDVKHHASDEENKLFPKVRDTVNKQTLMEIGKKLQEYHDKNNMKY